MSWQAHSTTPGHEQAEPPALRDLLKEINKIASKWYNLGIMLGLDDGKLDVVKADHGWSCEDCLREMLKIWLKQIKHPPSWLALAKAVEEVDEPKLAKEIKDRRCI